MVEVTYRGAESSDDVALLMEKLLPKLDFELESISVEAGIDEYLTWKKNDVAESTITRYEKNLSRFERFCEDVVELDDLSELDRPILDQFYDWFRHESSDQSDKLSKKTMADAMYCFRDFVNYLERENYAEPGLRRKVKIPELSDEDGKRNVDLEPERVDSILSYLERFHYASIQHVVWLLAARTGRRLGGFVGLDVCDVHYDVEDPYIEFKHRPPETPLKNQEKGVGHAAISEEVAEVFQHYVENIRPDVTVSDRRPFLATESGRLSRSTFRRYIYQWSRPCSIGEPCPVGRDPDECEATESGDDASKCPSSRSPHALRHGFISEARRQGVPLELLQDRCDVTKPVLKSVYDESDEDERREVRRDILDEYGRDSDGYLG